MSKLCLIAAVARNQAIGRDNQLLWHEPIDQQHFRRTTMGCPVIMGRKTWDSLPARFRPLPGRRNVVLSRNPNWTAPGAELAADLPDALQRLAGAERVFVIGGAELYRQSIAHADELVLTEIDADLDGDSFFPPWDRADFTEIARAPQVGADGTRFAFVTYRRKR